MPFPEVQRVVYGKPPLDQVICQFKFPPILRIDSQIPADFQERIRGDFPLLTDKLPEIRLGLSSGIEGLTPAEIEGQIPPHVLSSSVQVSGTKNYEFSSDDEKWKINLTRTFIALSTTDYQRWDGFKSQLTAPYTALIEFYSPSFFSRVGLRYVDVIKRSNLGLSEVGWDELLQPYAVGVLGSSDVANNVKSTESRYEIRLSDGESLVRMITKFVEAEDDGEICFMIDSDFHTTERVSIQDGMSKLNYFNLRSSRLFQWAITERLHRAMEPEII